MAWNCYLGLSVVFPKRYEEDPAYNKLSFQLLHLPHDFTPGEERTAIMESLASDTEIDASVEFWCLAHPGQ